MIFTDDDLNRFHANYDEMNSDQIDALIERLKAAELCAGYLGTLDNNATAKYLFERWKKAVGK